MDVIAPPPSEEEFRSESGRAGPLRILRVIGSVDPSTGGPVEGLKLSSPLLIERGHTVEVVSLDDPQSPWVQEFPLEISALGPAPGRYGFTPKLRRWLRDNVGRFDVAVIHGLWNYSSFGAWREINSHLPYVVFVHGMLDPWFNGVQPIKRWAKQAYWLAAEGRVLAGAQVVLFTSEEERVMARTSFLGHAYRERVVAYGAAGIPDRPNEQQAAFRAVVPNIGTRSYLLFMGRIHSKKGCDLLVAAFAKIATQVPDVDLVVAGPDQMGLLASLQREATDQGIADRVHWVGMLTGDAKWGAFRGAAAFVLPSHQENFGIAVAEAMSAGLPVLISNKVNIWREVVANGAGLAEPDDASGTFRLLRDFIGLPNHARRAMGERARHAYESSFGIVRAVDDLESVLSLALKARH